MRLHRAQVDAALNGLAGVQHAHQNVAQRRVARQLQQRHAFLHRHPRANRPGERLVAERHPQFVVHRQNSFHHAGENGLAAGSFQFQLFQQLANLRGGLAQCLSQRTQFIVSARKFVVRKTGVRQTHDIRAQSLHALRERPHELVRQGQRQGQTEKRSREKL